MVAFRRKPESKLNRTLRRDRSRSSLPSARIGPTRRVIVAEASVGQSSSEQALNRALDAWWQRGEIPPRDVLRDALLALQAGHPLDEPQRTLLLRAALFYGRGMVTALHHQSDPERTASIMRDMLLHIQRPLNPAQIAYLAHEASNSAAWFNPLLQLLHEESSGGLEPRRTLAAAAFLYLRQRPMVSATAWTPPSDLIDAAPQTQRALTARRHRQRLPILRTLANVLAVFAIFLLTAAMILLWQEIRQQNAVSTETRRIPSGIYLISADASSEDRLIEVAAFAIDRTEVTNGMYRRCYEAGICSWPLRSTSINRPDYFTNPTLDNYPMINVSWTQAQTYCEWVGKRLPLAEEWEIAAGSALTIQQRYLYPWGDSFEPQRVNGAVTLGGDAQPVASYTPRGDSPAGVTDMAGNVAEWTASRANPETETAAAYIVKGGSFLSPPEDLMVSASQIVNADDSAPTLGFRCALTLPAE